jgi:GT2 family glycosyltransferase
MAATRTDALTASVVICAYTEERWSELLEATESARGQTHPPVETVVVVDHNEALLARAREAIVGDGIVVVSNTGPQGLSGARNAGVAASTGDVVAFLDDDANAEPDWLETLIAAYADDRVIGAGGSIAPLWERAAPRWFPSEFLWILGCTYRGLPPRPAPVRNLIGANMSFRRGAIESVGGFLSGFGQVAESMLRCDDTEFCIRLGRRLPDGIILYEPVARVRHHVPDARTSWRYFRRRCYTEGLAKAQVSRLVGTSEGLSTERRYTLRTLPSGIGHGIADGLVGRDPAGLARSGAIVAGLAITTAGYGVGRVRRALASARRRRRLPM